MNEEKIAIRALFRHYWKKGLSASATAKQICEVEGPDIVHRSTVAIWFKRFSDGNTSLVDKPRSGRPSDVDNESLQVVLNEQPFASTRELSTIVGASKSSIHRHLKNLNFNYKRSSQESREFFC